MLQSTIKNRTIFCRDNIDILQNIDSETIDLIYLDPPFNKKKTFHAPIGSQAEGAKFKDTWEDEDLKLGYIGLMADKYPELHAYVRGIEQIDSRSHRNYLIYMAQRLIEMQRILKPTGSLYLHCDSTMSHYLKLLLDIVFGPENFRNEIVWYYGGPVKLSKRFPQKNDLIYFYSKSSQTTFYQLYEDLPDYLYKRARKDSDGRLWVDQRLGVKGETLEKLRKEGRTFTTKTGQERRKQYLDEMKGKPLSNMWHIPIINSQSKERLGYPTQKPLALLQRIIKASTSAGDVVLDPFCGCATTCIASENLNRQWVGIDVSEKAYQLVKIRLAQQIEGKTENGERDVFKLQNKVVYRADIPQRTDIENIDLSYTKNKVEVKHKLYDCQNGTCAGCATKFDYRHLTIDHVVPRAKGGGDNFENLQLLCHHCNSVKGDRNMNYLNMRLKELGIN